MVDPLFEASSTRVSKSLNLLTSSFLHRTGRYRPLIVLAPCCSATCFILLYLRWTSKPLALIESFYIGLAGFSNGVSIAAVFVFLTAGTQKEDTSICSGVFYLATSVGEITGFSVQNSILQGTLRQMLPVRLLKVDDKDEVCSDDVNLLRISVTFLFYFPPFSFLDSSLINGIPFGRVCAGFSFELNVTQIIRQVTASVSSIWNFPPVIQSVVIDTYVQGLRYTYRTLPHLSHPSIFPSSTTNLSPNHRSHWPVFLADRCIT